MPTIRWFEILIIVVVAILVVGPKDFPKMLKKIGSWIGSAKRYINNVQHQVSELQEVEIDEDIKVNQNKNNKKDSDEQKK